MHVMVSNLEQLQALLSDLKCEKEIAVDLEHHSYRTFLGITCLMQVLFTVMWDFADYCKIVALQ